MEAGGIEPPSGNSPDKRTSTSLGSSFDTCLWKSYSQTPKGSWGYVSRTSHPTSLLLIAFVYEPIPQPKGEAIGEPLLRIKQRERTVLREVFGLAVQVATLLAILCLPSPSNPFAPYKGSKDPSTVLNIYKLENSSTSLKHIL